MKQEPSEKPDADLVADANYYHELPHDHKDYWLGHSYEHNSEELAIRRLLQGKHFTRGLDIDTGYGRLGEILHDFCDTVELTQPTTTGALPRVGRADLIVAVHRLERLATPAHEFAAIAAVLHEDGYALIEVANYVHVTNRIRHLVRGKRLPTKPVDMTKRKPLGRLPGGRATQWTSYAPDAPFYSHNPETVIKQLAHVGLRVERTLSVSNLRNPTVRRLVPARLRLAAERALQPVLANSYLGPSIFFLAKKG